MHKLIPVFLFTFICHLVYCQQVPNLSSLTVDQIMQGESFVGYLPTQIRWSEDSRTIYFSWNPEMDTIRKTYGLDIETGEPTELSIEALQKLSSFGAYNKSKTQKVYSKYGDLFLHDIPKNNVTKITQTIGQESNPDFSQDEQHILFTKANNLYTWNIQSGETQQLTNFRAGKEKPKPNKYNHEIWLERDQLEYFDILAQRKAEKDLRNDRQELLKPKRPLAIYFGDASINHLKASPDLNYITFRLTHSPKAKGTKVPDFVTESGYVKDLRARSKVGTPQNTYQLGVYNRQADTVYYIDTEQIEGIFDKPAFLREYQSMEASKNPFYDSPREVIIHDPIYNDNGEAVVVIRSLDNKDRWIMALDLANGKLDLLDRQRDEAWVGGPGIGGWNAFQGNIGWMPDEKHIWFQSESTGYAHLYELNVQTKKKQALTSGEYEIINARLSNDKAYFFITANAEGPHEQHFYRMKSTGGQLEKITSKVGNHQVTISPDEKYLAIRYSYSNKPWELYLMENKPGASMKQLTNSTTKAFNNYPWSVPEIVWFTAKDGVKVPARLYRPAKPKRNGPAIIFVHGAGYLQNVHNWWSNYYREYMFHNLLTDNGYTVLDIDYRASNGYGRDWRTAIYRHMGGKDLDDQIDGAKFLVENYQISPDKIGIYGGSYGGFITLMALFKYPGTFKSGAALRSVTDWAHYNHGYTSNILNTPAEDSIAFYRSSPIYHAEGLQDNLLILHGMVDTNVQFQDVVRLAQRLIELKKDNWEFAVFPMEGHGFVEASSWADEYKRIFKLFQTTLK